MGVVVLKAAEWAFWIAIHAQPIGWHVVKRVCKRVPSGSALDTEIRGFGVFLPCIDEAVNGLFSSVAEVLLVAT